MAELKLMREQQELERKQQDEMREWENVNEN